MSTTLDTSGLKLTIEKLEALKKIDARDLMISWTAIISEDNRRGILQGLDKDGVPMIPVTYRPKPPGPLRPTKTQRGGKSARARKGGFIAMGSALHGNLSSAEYRLLGGPPLAPRDQFSRVITNLEVGWGGPPKGDPLWYAFGEWNEVVNVKGQKFLKYHFHAEPSKLPRRDLRGVRPAGIQKALEALRNWARLRLRDIFP